jgi:hypothetical protein
MVFILMTIQLIQVKAQDGSIDGYLNSGGTFMEGSQSLIGSIGEPVIGLIRQDWQHCLQGFVYKTLSANIVTSNDDLLNLHVMVKIYPNPLVEYLNIKYDGIITGDEKYQIIDESGRLVRSGKLTGPITQLNAGLLRPGAYVFLLLNTTTSKNIYQNKFVKLK